MTILSEGWQVPQRIIKWLGRNTGAFCHADDITAEVFADVLAKLFVEDAQAEGREPWKKLDVVMRGFALLQQNSAEDCVGILSTVDALLKGEASDSRNKRFDTKAVDFLESLENPHDEKLEPIEWNGQDTAVFLEFLTIYRRKDEAWKQSLGLTKQDDEDVLFTRSPDGFLSGEAWCQLLKVLMEHTTDGGHMVNVLRKALELSSKSDDFWVIGSAPAELKRMADNWDLLMPPLSYFDADPPPKECMKIIMEYDTPALLVDMASKLIAGVDYKWSLGDDVTRMPRYWAIVFKQAMVNLQESGKLGPRPPQPEPEKTCMGTTVALAIAATDYMVPKLEVSKKTLDELKSKVMSQIFALYSVITASLLLLFVQHRCGGEKACTVSNVLKSLDTYTKFVAAVNFLTFVLFIYLERAVWKREIFLIQFFAYVDFLPLNNLQGRIIGGSSEEEKAKKEQDLKVDDREVEYAKYLAKAYYYMSCFFFQFSRKNENGADKKRRIKIAQKLRKVGIIRRILRKLARAFVKLEEHRAKSASNVVHPAADEEAAPESSATREARNATAEALRKMKEDAMTTRHDAEKRMEGVPFFRVPAGLEPALRDGEVSEYPNLEALLNLSNYSVYCLCSATLLALFLNFCVSCGTLLTPQKSMGVASFIALINATGAGAQRVNIWLGLIGQALREESALSLYLSNPRAYNTISLSLRRPDTEHNTVESENYYMPGKTSLAATA